MGCRILETGALILTVVAFGRYTAMAVDEPNKSLADFSLKSQENGGYLLV